MVSVNMYDFKLRDAVYVHIIIATGSRCCQHRATGTLSTLRSARSPAPRAMRQLHILCKVFIVQNSTSSNYKQGKDLTKYCIDSFKRFIISDSSLSASPAEVTVSVTFDNRKILFLPNRLQQMFKLL